MTKLLLGKKAIIEQINNDNVLSVHSLSLIPQIKKICDDKNIIYKLHDKSFFAQFPSNHQGIIAYIKNNDYLTNDIDIFMRKINESHNKNKIIVILDRIEDTRNFGSIIRTCDAFSVDGIIIKNKNQAEINEFVIKASIGSIYNSNILKVANLNNMIEYLKENDYWIVSTTLEDSQDINDIKFNFNTCVIIGNEKDGISKNLISKSDFKANIKMYGHVQSLNVGVAIGIILNCIKKHH